MTLGEALARGVLVADGAMGTLGFARGLTGSTALWTLDAPETVEAIHREYVVAGARLLTTNTFGASRAWLPPEVDVGEVNRAAVAIARRAAAGRALVAGDVGPALDPSAEVLREQIAALVETGVDALLFETFASLDELGAALSAANDILDSRYGGRSTRSLPLPVLGREGRTSHDPVPGAVATGSDPSTPYDSEPGAVATGSTPRRVPVIASMTFERGARTRGGATPADFVALASDLGVDVVGANCSEGPESVIEVVDALARLTGLPILARPSAGVGEYLGPAEMADAARRLVGAGARIVGGCCGTTPETIAAITRACGGAS